MISTRADVVLLDTDILVDYLRHRREAIDFLEGLSTRILVSSITIAELFVGVRNDADAERLNTFLSAFETASVDGEIARLGGRFRARYGPSHGTGLADALIAASAEITGARLATGNRRHFPMVDDLLTPY